MRRRGWVGRLFPWIALLALGLISAFVGARLGGKRPPPPQPRLLVAFLDVGTGDCTLIRTPDGHAALIDTGSVAAGPIVAETLRREGIHSLDLLVLASPTGQSIGGVPGLQDHGISVAQVWDSDSADTGEARWAALQTLHDHGVPVSTAHAGDRFFLGGRGVRISVLWPPRQGARAHSDALICRLDYGNTGIVLAGPADGTEEEYLVASAAGALSCDVLQVAAGGADSATSLELLRRATPSVAVVSSSADGPPGPWTLHRLQSAGAGVWRTDTQGAITVYSDGRASPVVTAARM